MPKCVAYLRVSTAKQGNSGLGLEAQREAIRAYLKGRKWKLIDEVVEIESGKRNDRPALPKALALCRLHNATLIVGKLDRLARNTKFLLTVVESSGEAGVVFCDLPTIPEGPVGKFLLAQMASVAEFEVGLISQRTRAALRAAKARGVALGCRNGHIARYAARGAKASASVRVSNARKRSADLPPVLEALKGPSSRAESARHPHSTRRSLERGTGTTGT
jgi:DNA invertase Pin-like site-specific DNA recombinase